MTDRLRGTINARVWADTGQAFEGQKIYRSILGHYALNIYEDYLIELPEEAKKSVDTKSYL